jgi:predicted O-methyltransferase YrrM
LLEAARDAAFLRPEQVSGRCEALFSKNADPWRYCGPDQQERFLRALGVIQSFSTGDSWSNVLELGCAEGSFSALLAPSCRRLVCVDAAPTALDRAKRRLTHFPQVECRQFDLLSDQLDEHFDLIVIDHVIDMFHQRAAIRKVADLLADLLTPDGLVLVGAMRGSALVESTWWSRVVLRGGIAILDWVSRHTRLEPVKTVVGAFYVYTVFQRRR